MNISVNEVSSKFIDLISGRVSREEVDRWAYLIIKELEDGDYDEANENLIRSGLMYLYGINIKIEPDKYLHTNEDIIIKFNELFGGA